MIVLKMERKSDGTQKPKELIINDQIYTYSYGNSGPDVPNEEFFEKLKGFENYKIKVLYYNTEGDFIKETSHIIKDIRKNAVGIMSLKLD